MDASTLTLLLFGCTLAVGFIAYRHTATLGREESLFMRTALRFTFGACVFLATWSCIAFALWAAGIDLKIGTITDGRMNETWWLGPFCIVWAVLAYVQLKRSTK